MANSDKMVYRLQEKVLTPLNKFVRGRTFTFPLDPQFFGRYRLLIEFGFFDTFLLELDKDNPSTKVWLKYAMNICLPFTVPEAPRAPGASCDVNNSGMLHIENIEALIGGFSVFRVLYGYFGWSSGVSDMDIAFSAVREGRVERRYAPDAHLCKVFPIEHRTRYYLSERIFDEEVWW